MRAAWPEIPDPNQTTDARLVDRIQIKGVSALFWNVRQTKGRPDLQANKDKREIFS